MMTCLPINLALTLPVPSAPPSLSRWEREGARSPQASGKGEGDEVRDQ